MSGLEVYFTINTVDDQLPAWWKVIEAGSCRSTSLSVTVDVSAETECSDPWLGQGSGFLVMYRGEIPTIIAAAPKEAQQTISAGVTYAAFRLTINHARSNGPAACEGCEKPACISIDRMLLTTANKKDVELTEGLPGMGGAANVAKWQGGTPGCGAGAAKPSTWSELKRRVKWSGGLAARPRRRRARRRPRATSRRGPPRSGLPEASGRPLSPPGPRPSRLSARLTTNSIWPFRLRRS